MSTSSGSDSGSGSGGSVGLDLKKWTQARIGLSRSGNAISTSELLKFNMAHAEARDAVHAVWDISSTADFLEKREDPVCQLKTQADSKEIYLKRPDLGRRLDIQSRMDLQSLKADFCDLAFVVTDGLSATAIETGFAPFWDQLKPVLTSKKLSVAPILLVPMARVAVSDEVGDLLHVKVCVILLGERPGLSAADSMGIYVTYGPKVGNQDSQRNCISNIRTPDGLSYSSASKKLMTLLELCLDKKISGVSLGPELDFQEKEQRLFR